MEANIRQQNKKKYTEQREKWKIRSKYRTDRKEKIRLKKLTSK